MGEYNQHKKISERAETKETSGSFIVPCLTKFFGFLKNVSILELLRKTKHGKGYRAVDVYVLSWVFGEVFVLVLMSLITRTNWFSLLVYIIFILRLLEIFQVGFNVLIFDRIRKGDTYKISSPARLLILNLVNYLELILIYSGLYFLLGKAFMPEVNSVESAIYHSALSITTVGGNLQALTGYAQVLVISEVFFGLLFIVLIITRALSLFPQVKHIDKY